MNQAFQAVTTGLIACAAGVLLSACSERTGPTMDRESVLGRVLPAAATQGMSAGRAVHPHPAEVRLWEGVAPGSEGQSSEEIVNWRTEKDSITGESFSFPTVTNIHVPTITPFLPAKGKGTGAAVIIAPGGGHQFLTINHEGYDVAQYLADHGVAAFVLKYRLARAPGSTYQVNGEPVADARRAIRIIRSRAGEWGIDPKRVGVMGFSAGGEVAVQLILQGDGTAVAMDDMDKIPTRPDFQALIYPGQSKNVVVSKDTPPAFLACSFDDRPDIAEGLANVYLLFKRAGVRAELHIYEKGGHGFGIRQRGIAESEWGDQFLAWMKDSGYLQSK